MKANETKQLTIGNLEAIPLAYRAIIVDKEKLLQVIDEIEVLNDISPFKNKIIVLKDLITSPKNDRESIVNLDANGDTISLRKDVLVSEIEQILESQTLERAKYYLRRLKNGVSKSKTSKINDINLLRWKEYDNIITDSLWVLDKRDNSGAHLAWYWGNFIPQIPNQNQMLKRYTKQDISFLVRLF